MGGEHWTISSKRHRSQKRFIKLWGLENNINPSLLPCVVKLTRLAPGNGLDVDENLPMSVKYCKDYIADLLIPGLAPGRADGSRAIKWLYDQERHPIYALRIEIYPLEDSRPLDIYHGQAQSLLLDLLKPAD